MNKQPSFSPTKNSYASARSSLLLIVILSVVNIFSIIFAEVYFLFSAYLPQLLISIGYGIYQEDPQRIYLIVMGVLATITVIPYLLCWIFSKKNVGWMVGALVMFGLDSLLFLPDFFMLIASGDVSMILDLVIRIYAIVTLVLGVKYGFALKKEETAAKEAQVAANLDAFSDALQDQPSFDPTAQRTLTLSRKKSFYGCAMPMIVYLNGQELCRLKNGESVSVRIPVGKAELGGTLGVAAGSVVIDAGEATLSFNISLKSNLMTSHVIFEQY